MKQKTLYEKFIDSLEEHLGMMVEGSNDSPLNVSSKSDEGFSEHETSEQDSPEKNSIRFLLIVAVCKDSYVVIACGFD